jgi:hypothetical protein
LLILLPIGLRRTLSCRLGLLLLTLLVLGLILLPLACVSRNSPSEKQKHN